MTAPLPLVVAITGASGAPYAVRLLEALVALGQPTWLVVSSHGWRLLDTEAGIGSLEALRARVGADPWDRLVTVFDDGDRGARPASGTVINAGMEECPCSTRTDPPNAHGTSRSLVARPAHDSLNQT
ncbi:MAG: flavoprotein, partial [Gemmatimonadota bacterium]